MPTTPQTQLLTTEAMSEIVHWAGQAGQIALGYFQKTSGRYKANQTLVTQADLEIERFLVQRLRTAFPDHGVLGEEGYRSNDLSSQAAIWTIDPLDGTSVFCQGLPGWGISIGLLWQGRPVFGLFYMPLTGDLTCASDHHNENPHTVQTTWQREGFLAVSASAHRLFHLNRINGIRTLGSVGASLVYTARGVATAALLPKARLWDLAGGAAILAQAGGELRYLSGQPVDYLALLDGELAPEPIVAGHPAIVAELQQTVRPVQGGC